MSMELIKSRTMPFFSVIVPSYNRAERLKRAVQSILAQSFRDFEIIVVNDGSTDGTEAVMREIRDTRVVCLSNETNRERSYSRNRGISTAKGEWITFLDSDDEWLPDHLATLSQAIRTGTLGEKLIFTQMATVRDGIETPEPRPPVDAEPNPVQYIITHQPGITTFAIHASCLREFRFNESLFVNEDLELLGRLAVRHGIFLINKVTVLYHKHETNTWRIHPDTVSQRIKAMKSLFSDNKVARCVDPMFRENLLKQLRHSQIGISYKHHVRLRFALLVLLYLLRYPACNGNRAKIILLASVIPVLPVMIPRIKRAAKAVSNAYY